MKTQTAKMTVNDVTMSWVSKTQHHLKPCDIKTKCAGELGYGVAWFNRTADTALNPRRACLACAIDQVWRLASDFITIETSAPAVHRTDYVKKGK